MAHPNEVAGHLTLPTTPRTPPISDILAYVALGLGVVIAVSGLIYAYRLRERAAATRETELGRLHEERGAAEQERASIVLAAREEAHRLRSEAEAEVRERRAEVARLEQRLAQHEEGLEKRNRDVEQGEQRLTRREEELEQTRQQLEEERTGVAKELERVAGMSQEEARTELLRDVEGELDHEVAERIRAAEHRVREEADERSREILITTMQRHASEQTGEAAVTVLHLPTDDLKGRIIGREGRNIRALEMATGVDIIVDDTPEAVILSSFDPVRRELARLSIQKLVTDGRIHPARIEDIVESVKSDLELKIKQEGESAVLELKVRDVHPELIKLLGKLKYRTSYGQNVLQHSKEVAMLAAMMAREIGADVNVALRAGLLHDIGKAVDKDVEGTHTELSVELTKKYGETEKVVQAIASHHRDVDFPSIEAVLVQSADTLSAARPGARRELLETYIQRLEKLEEIATSFDGVSKAFALQAGREIRIIVESQKVSDDRAALAAKEIAARIKNELDYPGQIKVTVIREMRAVEYAR